MKLATRMLSFFIAAAMLYLLAPAAWAEGTETELPEEDEPILVADEEGFTEIVNALIREFGREADDYCGISVGFCYTKTNESLFYYGDEWYYTASVFKLPLMMMLANDVLNGENPIGDYAGGPDEVLRECLVNSDNTRAFVTASYYYTWPRVRENEQKLAGWTDDELPEGFQSWEETPKYSCRFLIDILRELYANSDQYPSVIDYMSQAQPGEFLRQNELTDLVIAQKFGSLTIGGEQVNHIAGIVYTDTPILITVMTRDFGYYYAKAFCGRLCEELVSYSAELDQRYAEKEEQIEQEKLAEQLALAEVQKAEAEREAAEKAAAEESARLAAENAAKAREEARNRTVFFALLIACAVLAAAAAFFARHRKKKHSGRHGK